MKKIGIITFQKSHGNYGASLQCFALWKYLDNKGFKSEVIDLLRPEHDQYKESKKFKWNFNKPSIFKIYLSKLKLFVLSCIGGTKSNVKYSQTRLKRFKDFNDIAIRCNVNEITHSFIQKNTFEGLEGIIKLSEIKKFRRI